MNENITNIIRNIPKKYDWLDKINFEKFLNYDHYSSPSKLTKFLLHVINHLEEEHLTFVLPEKKQIAYILTIYLALEKIRQNQNFFYEDFEKFLKPGSNIVYCLDNEDKGKVYKYIGKKEGAGDITIIETLPSKRSSKCIIERKIKNLLQFYPTTKLKPIGTRPPKDFIPKATHIDNILGITTFDNPFLLRNSVIILTEKKNINNFFNQQKINGKLIKDFITLAQINEQGDLEKFKNYDTLSISEKEEVVKIEPLIIYCHSIYHLYEYFKKNNNSKIVITDSVTKINNFTILKQIKEINSKIKFISFCDYDDYEILVDFNQKKKHPIWKFEKSEINDWAVFDNESIQNIKNYNQDDANSILKKVFSDYIIRKNEIIDIPANIFDKINRKLNILNDLSKSSQNQDDLEAILYLFRESKGKVQDYIFEFNEELKEVFNNNLNKIKILRNDRKNFFTTQEYDTIIEIERLFSEIDLTDENFFKNRLKILRDFLESSKDIYNKSSTTFIVDNPKVKKHYEDNIKEKFNLDFDISSTFKPKRNFKYALILSELSERRLLKILNKNYYKNLIFIATPTFKENIHKIIDLDFFKWKNLLLENEHKLNISKIKNISASVFNFKEHNMYNNKNLNSNEIIKIQIEKPFLKILKSEPSGEDKIETNFVEFYGECYCLFSKNTKIKILNDIFFNSKGKDQKDINELMPDDYVLLRDSSDSDVVESEARLLAKFSNIDYDNLYKNSGLWLNLLWKHLDLNGPDYAKNKSIYKKILKKNGFNKTDGTFRNLIGNLIICPDDKRDLEILMLSLNEYAKSEIISKKEISNIYNAAYNQKKLHRQAGRNISKKIAICLASEQINIDREPMRVDFNKDNSITLNSDETSNPEAWIVQVRNIDKDVIYSPKIDTNRLKWMET